MHVKIRWGGSLIFLLGTMNSAAMGQDHFFDSDGVRIRYHEAGGGEPVVLVHGVGNRIELWYQESTLFEELAKRHRVIAFDLRGHGLSDKPHDVTAYGSQFGLDIIRLLDHLGIERAHIVGYSLGAAITLQLLTTHSDRFRTAVLIAAPGSMTWTPQQEAEAQQRAEEIATDCVSRTQIIRLSPPDSVPTEADIQARKAACLANPEFDRLAAAAVQGAGGMRVVSPEAVAAIRVPLFGVVGSRDTFLENMRRLQELQPTMPLLVVEGASHNGPARITRWPEAVSAISEWLSAHSGA